MKNVILLVFMSICSITFAEDKIEVERDSLAPVLVAKDTVKSSEENPLIRQSLFIVPMGYYKEETSVALGVVGGYYLKSNSLSKISSLGGSIVYTFRNQFMANLTPKFYTKNERFFFTGNINIRYYPDFYYGIGNVRTKYKEPYIARNFQLVFQPSTFITGNWQLGLSFMLRGENVIDGQTYSETKQEIFTRYGNAGWSPYVMFGVGVLSVYDTRDNLFYPQKYGNFFKVAFLNYNKFIGSSFNVNSFNVDFRQYLPTFLSQMFVYQLYLDCRLGNDIPFQMLPSVGGVDNMRGFREKIFVDNTFFQFQTEYRVPLWKRLKASFFCSTGDVLDIYNPIIQKIKFSYGGGLRCRINDARVNLRADFAFNNYGGYQFYIDAMEAF